MRKIHLFGIALAAMCAFSGLVTASAFAELTFELAEWLSNGNPVTAELLVDAEGEILLENFLNGGAIQCSGLFEGAVLTEPENVSDLLLTMLYSLGGTLIEELDEAAATGGLSCTGEKTCETGSEVWANNLPWLIEIELDIQTLVAYGLLFEDGKGIPSYSILCLFLGSSINELCEVLAGTTAELVNAATGVEAVGVAEPLGTCNGNAEDGLVNNIAGNLIMDVNGEVLSISK